MLSSTSSYQTGEVVATTTTRSHGRDGSTCIIVTGWGLLLGLFLMASTGFLLFHPPLDGTTSARLVSKSVAVTAQNVLYTVVPRGDFGPYKEYSVIHSDRSLNLMSSPFQEVMHDLSKLLKITYNADRVAIIPGYVELQLE